MMYTPTQSYGLFQSTRPHGARHDDAADTLTGIVVSIHAPTRGATPLSCGLIWRHLVSIHAPTRGATKFAEKSRLKETVSIHAPTRGATRVHALKKSPKWSFNPRAHTGRDLIIADPPYNLGVFQSTRPHGARRGNQETQAPNQGFNPRAHTGRDIRRLYQHFSRIGFNPRAHTGRDAVWKAVRTARESFNPRAHTGRDVFCGTTNEEYFLFQSTRPHGARLARTVLKNEKPSFNPRAHTGRDFFRDCRAVLGGVSIHAPTRGATCLLLLLLSFCFVSIHAPTRGATRDRIVPMQ